jgi:hypothetical protein
LRSPLSVFGLQLGQPSLRRARGISRALTGEENSRPALLSKLEGRLRLSILPKRACREANV